MKNRIVLFLLMLILGAQPLQAMVNIRVSVKFILDSSGQRPSTNNNLVTDDQVRDQIARGNAIFVRAASGYEFELVEIVNVSGASQWFNADARDTIQRLALQTAALANPSLYRVNPNAINVYINGNTNSGNSAILPPDQIILIGQGGRPTTIAHEMGHYLGLYHTQGRFCGGCSEPPAPGAPIFGNLCSSVPDTDEVADTLPDLQCWTTNQVAQNAFGTSYSSLNSADKARVDAVYYNLMSYHPDPRDRLTAGQIDRVTDSINGARFHTASGRTVFVDRNNTCARPEDLAEPFKTLALYTPGWSWGTRQGLGVTLDARFPPPGAPSLPCPPNLPCSLTVCLGGPFKNLKDAVNDAVAGDRLQIKAGTYTETVRITKRLTLTADRGTVRLGAP